MCKLNFVCVLTEFWFITSVVNLSLLLSNILESNPSIKHRCSNQSLTLNFEFTKHAAKKIKAWHIFKSRIKNLIRFIFLFSDICLIRSLINKTIYLCKHLIKCCPCLRWQHKTKSKKTNSFIFFFVCFNYFFYCR